MHNLLANGTNRPLDGASQQVMSLSVHLAGVFEMGTYLPDMTSPPKWIRMGSVSEVDVNRRLEF